MIVPLFNGIIAPMNATGPAVQSPRLSALILRGGALFAILYQFRFLAGDLADTPVYITTLVCAFTVSWGLAAKRVRPLAGLLILILTPWTARGFIALPRLFVNGENAALILDSLLLNLDRNSFVSILPYYWAAVTTFFSVRSRRFLRADIIGAQILLLVIFCVVRTADMEVYRWPVLMLALFAAIIFLQILALMLSLPPAFALQRKEGVRTGIVLFIMVILGGALLIRPSQEKAVDRGGGLLQPNLFKFDFSQILRLESEISLNEDLVLIVRKDPEDTHEFLRRFVLSGYSGKQGFFRIDDIDEAAHPQRLPDRRTQLPPPEIKEYRVTNQEYFLVNFDSSAFIGMNEPVEIVPFDSWDASSFSSAYAVQSHTSEAMPFELFDAVRGRWAPLPPKSPTEVLDMSDRDYALYTEYGGDVRIAGYAQEITEGLQSYWDKIQAVYEWLKYGDYRYSLKPGIAPDGDQLGYFLFDSKKGYCSYYAFSMTLLVRSLGIPARVAVGFFVNPDTNTFDYYPVQSNMAHAWVEVWYPEYGWIEYDPTTTYLAADEDFQFSSGVSPDLFERLMKEILDNHSRLSPKEGEDENTASASFAALSRRAGNYLKRNWLPIALILICALFLSIRTGHKVSSALRRHPRKKAIRLWAHVLRRLRLAGFRRNALLPEAEWVRELDSRQDFGLYALYQEIAAARYAPVYNRGHLAALKQQYTCFSKRYGTLISLPRRILAWVLPPLALALPPWGGTPKSGSPKGTVPLMVLLLLFTIGGDAIRTQELYDGPDALYLEAQDAQQAEFWERAIELYSRGSEAYPFDTRFPWALGSLYYSRQLYGLAWDEFRKVEAMDPTDPNVLYRLSRTAGYLNRDTVSAEYLERLLIIEPDNREAIGSLGWMYYKLHRLREGEQLLTGAMDRYGNDPDYAMTLGTIYSDMFRYDDAKAWYLDAIAAGEDIGDRDFTAVAHYNLSILESRFYNYALSFDRTNASLASRNRASGRLARGELFLRRLELSRAFTEYQDAYEIDTSPLSKVNLAQAYQFAGRLEEARLYAEDCLNSGDLSWMLNYGIDPVRYKRDLHEILKNTYAGLTKTESRMVYGTFSEKVSGLFRYIWYRFMAAYHKQLFQKYCLLAADAYDIDSVAGGEQHLDALLQYYDAFESYPRRAMDYLRRAREFETPLIPQSIPSYDLEEGTLLKDTDLLRRIIPDFDPLWERDGIADAYTELALHAKGEAEARDAAERLYALNHGALRQNGIALPVELSIDAIETKNPAKTERTLRRTLKKMGIDATPVGSSNSTVISATDETGSTQILPNRFRLSITIAGGNALCELYDGGRGVNLFRRSIPLGSLSGTDISAFARALGDGIFVVDGK
ncbi:hypothetical protein FACS1894141_3600 [Spirochaetia bacterium]|nr:hypothetical protein FACS1894141_3600 [Spirochaetia bacterium]